MTGHARQQGGLFRQMQSIRQGQMLDQVIGMRRRDIPSGMGERAENRQLVRAMINMAHNLHLEVVAEGVENAEQLALLRQFGCDQVQGYLISKPLPLAELARFLVFGLRQPLLGGLPS